MHEIKFRGFNGEKWLFGNLEIDYKTKQAAISDDRWWRHPVRFETVGQFTGLTDSTGKGIYEGDLLEMSPTVYDECKDFKFPVFYHNGAFIVTGGIELCDFLMFGKVTIIGNIYDNPDLLEAHA